MWQNFLHIFKKKHSKAQSSAATPIYYNREISWLQFNERVLSEAANLYNPLLERVRFLSISASNLDEFRRVRIAGLKAQISAEVTKKSIDGLTAEEQLPIINTRIKKLIQQQAVIWRQLKEELANVGIYWQDIESLSFSQKQQLEQIFHEQLKEKIFSYLIDEQHSLPFLPNGSISILSCFLNAKGEEVFYLHRLSRHFKAFITLAHPKGGHFYFFTEDVAAYFLSRNKEGLSLKHANIIRILRDADLALEEHAEDLYLTFENALTRRRKQAITAIEYKGSFKKDGLSFWASFYNLDRKSFCHVKNIPVGLSRISELIDGQKTAHLFPAYERKIPKELTDYKSDIFALISQKDYILHHPYEKFDPVVALLTQAAEDENVVAIHQTLYRTSHQSPIVEALKNAALKGKAVTAMIELKARFDEENNLKIARRLDKAGAHVLLGHARLKTHAKLCLIQRKQGEQMAYYAHIGTGNYHPVTAKIYTDLSLFTCNEDIGKDIMEIFNYMGGISHKTPLKKLIYAPDYIGDTLLALIEQEIQNAKKGKHAEIWAKMNSLLETQIINKLYEASQAGVKITLNIRGICALKAGVAGLSENIEVFSVVGRFLEHSRVFIFAAGQKLNPPSAKIYISSADWMFRNIHRRIEVMTPIESLEIKKYILKNFVNVYNADEGQSWRQQPDGEYVKVTSASGTPLSCQEAFIKIAAKRSIK